MPDLDLQEKARRIVALFRDRTPTPVLPEALRPTSLAEAYEIRAAFQEIEEKEGRGPVAGYKIGLTTPVMQRLCGIDEPCWGAIFASEVHHGRAELAAAQYCRLGVETEIALRLGADPPRGGDRAAIAAAVDAAMAAIELIEDLGYDYKRLDAAAMIAGNAWNAGIVLAPPVADWHKIDLARASARLSINGREIGAGSGSDVMGSPLHALAWLADRLAAAGTPLRRGMVVMTGSMVPIQYPRPGDRVRIEVSGLGAAELVVA
ncbi:MAG TPA: fumarylacetoacetate hydrolase family protein [Stellaceae bacterium]|nr:fumarylacetoacetate hydrolase family protein [Stellaceae bacterium]